MLSDAQKAASRVFADAMIGYAIKRLEERIRSAEDNGLEFTAPTAAEIEDYKQKEYEAAEDTAVLLLTPEGIYEKHCRGGFHPRNRDSRQLLESLHSITLPPTVGGTDNAVKSLIGHGFVLRKQRESEEEERKEIDAKVAERIARIEESIRNNAAINGGELCEIANHYRVNVHPRTAGTLRNRVKEIRDGQARLSSGKRLPDTVWSVYESVARIVKETQTV